MKHSLVTGAAGFIGFHLAKHLHAAGQRVTVVDNFFRGEDDKEFSDFCQADNVLFKKLDLTNPDSMHELSDNYDYVYDLAAINGTKNFYSMPHEVLRVNLLSVINLLGWLKDKPEIPFLFASSSEAYAGSVRLGIAEVPTKETVPLCIDDVQNPRWSYGGSKLAGELLVLNYAKFYNLNTRVIRYHNVYGPRMGYDHVIPEFCERINKKANPFPIYGTDDTRTFCYASDAVKATQLVMEEEKLKNEIVNIGSDDEITITALAEAMFGVAAWKPAVEIHPSPAGSVARRCPDLQKLKNSTGYSPKVSLDEGLRETMKWYTVKVNAN